MNKKTDSSDLEFDFDDSLSMGDLMGYTPDDLDKKEPGERRNKQPLPPMSLIDTEDTMDMDALLEEAPIPDEEEDAEVVAVDVPGMPTDIFGNLNTHSMDDLFVNGSDMESSEGHIIDISLNGAVATMENGQRGLIDKAEFPDWSAVQIDDDVTVEYSANDPGPDLTLRLITHEARLPVPIQAKAAPTHPKFDGFKPNTTFVIDASNVCRSYVDATTSSSPAPLLSLVEGIMAKGGACICVFDANERYVLGQNRKERNSERIYEALLTDLSKVFIEAPATGCADDALLKIAHRERVSVISNDRFNKASDHHREQYSWLVPGGSRLIRGSADNGTIRVPRLKLSIPLSYNLNKLVQSIKLMLLGG